MVAEVHQLKYRTLLNVLACSILLNLFLSFPRLFTFPAEPDLPRGWSRRAAAQAEAIAALRCSGHGRAFLDGVPVGGTPTCECNTCYGGHDCSELLPDCPADADSGDALLFEQYWRQHASASAVLLAGWHRMGYDTDAEDFLSVELEKHVRLLHATVGNAVTEGRFIVFGAGATQLINAAVRALSPDNTTSPARVVASAPYFALFKQQTVLLDSREYEWGGVTSAWLNRSASPPADFIEIVTSPNNPDGLLRQPVLGGSSVIYDQAYYWPHFTAIHSPADEDVMLFSMSKISGHAGSRFGWAIVKNESIYRSMSLYVGNNTMGVSRDTHLRILTILKAIIAAARGGGDDDIFVFGRRVLHERWRRLNVVVSTSGRFSLQRIAPQYCTYFKDIRDPSPAYGWLKCEMEADEDCSAVLRAGGIVSRPGSVFEAHPRYARLSLIRTRDDFEMLLPRLEALAAQEEEAAATSL